MSERRVHEAGQGRAPVPPLMCAGAPMHLRLSEQVPTLARTMVRSFVEAIPIYRKLPAELVENDVTRIVEENLILLARMLRERRAPTDEELSGPSSSAARRAEEGIPLAEVLRAYRLGAESAWTALTADATADDVADVVAAARIFLHYQAVVTEALSSAYLLERQGMDSQDQLARQSLIAALLSGDGAPAVAAAAGIRLPARYLVLSVALARHPDEIKPSPSGPITSRRKLQRVRAELQKHGAEPVLSVLDADGGVVLVPLADGTPDTASDWAAAAGLVGALSTAAGVDVAAAGEIATADDVPEAVILARDVLDVVRTFDRPPGFYRLTDVLLEYQATRPGAGRTALAELLHPISDHPDLLHTLEIHLANRLDRRATAAELNIHANTVDYRLRRASSMTGLNLADPSDLPRIAAALAARRATLAEETE